MKRRIAKYAGIGLLAFTAVVAVVLAALYMMLSQGPVSLNFMTGSEIDFVDDLIGSSFKVNNPKATASCGCGTSFAL